MTDAIKVTDMLQQRTLEYERQRHLTNWLLQSSPHMPNQSEPPQQPSQNVNHSDSHVKKQRKIFNTSLFLNKFRKQTSNQTENAEQALETVKSPAPLITPQAVGQVTVQQQHTKLKSGVSSQTTLPLQIVQPSRDGNKAKLRRFNSHDTSANMFSVADFENARMARRNELELVRKKQSFKMNSMSSGCDSSTGDSKGSKLSNESKDDPMQAGNFLDRYSLPRIARLYSNKSFPSEQQQKPQNSVLSRSKKSSVSQQQPTISTPQEPLTGLNARNDTNCSDDKAGSSSNNSELFLLFRRLKKYKVYHAVNAKSSTSRKKGIKIPQDFAGYFSLVTEKQTPTATQYTTMTQLVRERVYKFLSIDNMQAYTESKTNDKSSGKAHYVKITAKAGEVFRLLAVFEDGSQDSKAYTSPKKSSLNSIGREKEKGRYVQLMSENRQIIFVALSTKGKFYEIDQSSSSQLFSKSNSKQLNDECVYKISSINDDTSFPITLRLISKHSSGIGQSSTIPEIIKITKLSFEDSVIACPIDEAEFCNPLHLVKLYLHPEMKFIKCTLGFENEKMMFSNQNVQNLLKFCQFNCESFMRTVEFETLPKEIAGKFSDSIGKVKTPSAFSKFFSHEKNTPAHEREDSIIFLSKNDLENLEQKKQLTQESYNGLPVEKKSWLKNLGNSYVKPRTSKTNSVMNLNSNSIDRYMSKMIQERFGTIELNERSDKSTTLKSSSEISYDLNDHTNNAIQKCFSLQNIERDNSMDLSMQPSDSRQQRETNHQNETDDDKIEKDLMSLSHHSPNLRQKSFITEKLFNEFYVKTKQYSKSSSSLHQLLHFSVPQKMNIRETKKRSEEIVDNDKTSALMHLQLPPPPSQENLNAIEAATPEELSSILSDDLPYCSVRDSILQLDSSATQHREGFYAEISANALESSFQMEPPIQASSSKHNISSIRISFPQDSLTKIDDI